MLFVVMQNVPEQLRRDYWHHIVPVNTQLTFDLFLKKMYICHFTGKNTLIGNL